MKIAQVIPNLRVGGAEIMCENLTRALIDDGQEVFVISLYDDETIITKRLIASGVKIYFLHKKPGPDFGIIKRITDVIKKEKPDAIHAHLYAASYAMISAIMTRCKSRIITIHSLAQEDNSVIGRLVNRLLFSIGNVVPVALNKQVQKTIVEEYRISKDKVPVIYNGIDLRKCVQKVDYNIKDEFIILHVGRFSPVKNHTIILKAFEGITDVVENAKLMLVGDGELYHKVQEYVEKKGLSAQICFEGQKENVYPYYTQADVFILPSVYEGMPMSIIEAMGSGLPIIASNVGGIKDMIDDDINGILIDPNTEELKNALIELYNDSTKRKKLGTNAHVKSELYSSKNMAEKYKLLYTEGALR